MVMGHKRERPDYKSYCHNEYALRCAKCALVEVAFLWRAKQRQSVLNSQIIHQPLRPFVVEAAPSSLSC